MFKNVASQKIAVFVYDSTTGAPKTGDSANLTAYVSKDYGSVTVLGDTSATEMDSTNAKGWYLFDLTQAETNADALLFTGKSSTSNIYVVGALIYTDPPNFTAASIDANGRVDVIKTGYALTSGERNSIADAMLDRDMSTGADNGSTTVRTVRQALRFLRNKFAIVAGTLSVYKEDDTTASWTATLTTTAGNPVSSSDPTGP